MATLRYKNQKPPGGFVFIEPTTRARIEDDNLPDLVKKVMEHREYKKLPFQGPEATQLEIERQICTRLTKSECRSEGTNDEWQPSVVYQAILKPQTIISASRAALEWARDGGAYVDEETALKRRETCLACPLNTPLTGCKCGTVYKALNAAVPKEKRHDGLGVCAVCLCALNLKVWMPRKVIDASNAAGEYKYPDHCWQPKQD